MTVNNQEKWFWIIMGPNGAGKSTFRQDLPKEMQGLHHIDPDAIAKEIQEQYLTLERGDAYTLATVSIREKIKKHLDNNESFSMETVTGSATALRQAKSHGYKVGVAILGLSTIELAEQRVHKRVTKGGHSTSYSIKEMWEHSALGSNRIIPLADKALVYDADGPKPHLIARKTSNHEPLVLIDSSKIQKNPYLIETTKDLETFDMANMPY